MCKYIIILNQEKLLDELDEEFGVGSLVEEEKKDFHKNAYTAKDLKGLKVGHSLLGFRDESSLILTLKDQEVLGEGDDVLVNVNMIENERYVILKKNKKLKTKKKNYCLIKIIFIQVQEKY